MSFAVGTKQDIVIGVIVTDRVAGLSRLLASLEPVAHDPNVHVIVLDNGSKPSEISRLVIAANSGARGQRSCVPGRREGAPLHENRVQLSVCIADWAKDRGLAKPIVWMIDDDLTFERLKMFSGYLVCQNVAGSRMAQVRELAKNDRCDLLVSGFTGDAPVRPNAVISCQLGDLRAELERLVAADPASYYIGKDVDPALYIGDYYYSHTEERSLKSAQPYPWLVRPEAGSSVTDQLVTMLGAAQGIELGRGVFRPLLEERDSDTLCINDSLAPNRGGNAVFFGLEPLLAHHYPAFSVGEGYSRRSDMVGSTLLAKKSGYRVAEGNLSLLHDRRDQEAITAHPGEWLREFAGVMLSRLVMQGVPSDRSSVDYLKSVAEDRAHRIQIDARRIVTEVEQTLSTLDQTAAIWWKCHRCRPLVRPLRSSLTRIQHTFGDACRQQIFEKLSADDVLQSVSQAYAHLDKRRFVW
ncbi:hypothetical protein [Marinobacter sp. HL-58]|uniref:hypothetical protein n=1 Tax=Marinobacter sp. HL-58 TaxID=1479237 RepID=UPI00056B6596|nr:hypothetical protein [Marinobacter sp. HL-58]KPQ01672.1 MAG: hypothetical protein HLUCCO03_11645 [Marinobacter sp. HL-58]